MLRARRSLIQALPLLLLSLPALPSRAADPTVDQTLRQMDAASAKFQSTEADFKWDFLEKVVNETSSQTGSIYFVRKGAEIEMGAQVLTPGKKTLQYRNGGLDLFDGSTKETKHFDAGANRGQYESFLTLGFGGSGRDLERVWNIKLAGTANMDGGYGNVPVVKLDLTPKDPAVARTFTHVVITVDPARGISLVQHFYTPEGDERTATYTHIRYNLPVNTKRYSLPKR